MPIPLPVLSRPLSQPEREMAVGSFLDVTVAEWLGWIVATDDEAIPTEVNELLAGGISALRDSAERGERAAAGDLVASAEVPGIYQHYLQAIALLSDSALVWSIRQLGRSPFDPSL